MMFTKAVHEPLQNILLSSFIFVFPTKLFAVSEIMYTELITLDSNYSEF